MPRPSRAPTVYTPDEIAFMKSFMLAIGTHPSLRIHRQNVAQIPVRDRKGKVVRYFDAGPPNGAADVSGIVRPEGWRLEVEFKSETGTRSDAQISWADMITAFGGVYALITYNSALSPEQNVRAAVAAVLQAIEARRAA